MKYLAPILALLVPLAGPPISPGQTACQEDRASLADLFGQQRWPQLAECFRPSSDDPPDHFYYHGMALARVGRWDEARKVLETGAAKAPGDRRFLLELAGLAFKSERYGDAKRDLRRALELDPEDDYANNFLGTLYFLEGNLDAALKYWNRVAKPFIDQVTTEPEPRIDPALLDRALALSPSSPLRLPDLETSRRRLELLGVFPAYRFELLARDDERFDLRLRTVERNGWGASATGAVLGLLRGIPYQTVHAEYLNAGGDATNVRSLLRWDPNKRRAFLEIARPLGGEARHRYRLFVDARDENWRVPKGAVPAASFTDFGFQKHEAGLELTSVVDGRLAWAAGVSMARRSFRDAELPAASSMMFDDGWLGQSHARLDYRLLRIPEQRLTVDFSLTGRLGKVWREGRGLFSQAESALRLHWFPQADSDDYELTAAFRAGTTFGRAPFDALYSLGLERDNDLWLRGHIGTLDGMKGAAPLGDRYLLLNWEVDRTILDKGFVKISAGPFLDGGWISGAGGVFRPHGWLWDSGVQCKLRTFDGLVVTFIYGKGLGSTSQGLYGMVSR